MLSTTEPVFIKQPPVTFPPIRDRFDLGLICAIEMGSVLALRVVKVL